MSSLLIRTVLIIVPPLLAYGFASVTIGHYYSVLSACWIYAAALVDAFILTKKGEVLYWHESASICFVASFILVLTLSNMEPTALGVNSGNAYPAFVLASLWVVSFVFMAPVTIAMGVATLMVKIERGSMHAAAR